MQAIGEEFLVLRGSILGKVSEVTEPTSNVNNQIENYFDLVCMIKSREMNKLLGKNSL